VAEYVIEKTRNDIKAYVRFGETEVNFSYSTNGYVECILFGETMIWDSEMDDREWIEEKNDYEPFEPFIKRTFNTWVDKLHSLKF
jgi:hypothetical protein